MSSTAAAPGLRLWSVVVPLAVAQLVSWGSIFYGFSLFVAPLRAEFGWSPAALNGALSAGLLVAGLCAYPIGLAIDRGLGRSAMVTGSLLAAAALAGWTQADSLMALYAVWLVLGVAMACTLYEPVFAVLTRAYPGQARHAITVVTLVAGFASTVFIPLTSWLLEAFGWRATLWVLAAFNLVVALPIHLVCVPAGTRHPATPRGGRAHVAALVRRPRFWALAVWLTAYGFTTSSVLFQTIPLLQERGVAAAWVVGTMALIGPSQVIGRVLLLLAGDRVRAGSVGLLTALLLPAAIVALALGGTEPLWLVLFAVSFGAANGVITILRGAVPGEWLGFDGIGQTLGLLATPLVMALAGAPLVTALTWRWSGSAESMTAVMLGCALLSAAGFFYGYFAADESAPAAE